jgi:hypothetical protein
MKAQKFVFLIFVCFGLLLGCNKYEMPGDDLADVDLKKAVKAAVFVVEPSGGDDTPAIMQAFDDAKAAGPGSVVQLCEGEYYLGFIEIREFYGTFKGAGKNKTLITVMNNLDGQAMWNSGLHTDLVKFVGGNIVLLDFTIQTPEGKMCITGPTPGHIRSFFNFSAWNKNYEPGNNSRSISVEISNIGFYGHPAAPTAYYNCLYAIKTGQDVYPSNSIAMNREKINIKITKCDFDFFRHAVWLVGMIEGNVEIGGKNQGNHFSNNWIAVFMMQSFNMKFSFTGNMVDQPKINGYFGSDSYAVEVSNAPYNPGWFLPEVQTRSTLTNIEQNTFNIDGVWSIGMWFHDRRRLSGEPPTMFQVRNNLINLMDDYAGGIYFIETDGVVVRNNKFTGTGFDGIVAYVGILPAYAQNGLILGNNFSGATFHEAAVWLGKYTRDWSIVGGNIGEKVINLGENNIITGFNVNESESPFGKTIVDNLKGMKEAMHEY